MKIYVVEEYNQYAADGYEWQINPEAVFLNEDDAKAYCKSENDKEYKRLVDERNRQEQDRYQNNLRNYHEDKSLREHGIRTGGTALVEPKAPEIFTEPWHGMRGIMATYTEYEAR